LKYKSNLGSQSESISNNGKMILIAIICFAIVAIGTVIIKIKFFPENKNLKQKVNVYFDDSISTPEEKDGIDEIIENLQKAKAIEENQTQQIDEKPKQTVKPKRKRFKKKPQINKTFVNSLQGYEIRGIAMSKGVAPVVYLANNDSTKAFRVGDKLGLYQITEIHRTYILLKQGSDIIHLNNLN
jgi:multidrug efflux pump subunit AcrB